MENGNTFESTGVERHRSEAESGAMAIRATIRNLGDGVGGVADVAHDRASLAVAARSVCAAARRDGLHIEQALVCVKEAWKSTPGRPKPRPGSSDAVLDKLISACIREFYAKR